MKLKHTHLETPGRKLTISVLLFLFISISQSFINAQDKPLRRPISPQQPMWLIHIDTWNWADPQKIIDLIPQDIRPYVVMNISLSISHDVPTGRFKVAEYGYEIAKSWLRVCAENQMWTMIQPSSGGYAQFSDIDLSVYEEFYRDYPNFIGFNYAEQFWGFDDPSDPLSSKWTDRMAHFADLLKISNKYGGYLSVSWAGNQWGPSINPIGMMKRNPDFATACRDYTKNYILTEKYTQQSYQSDMESVCLGAYLSGYSGNYGIRYDDTGWTDPSGVNINFTMATGLAPHLEHAMLTGQTVIDGPELIWTQCFKETSATVTADGFSRRNWQTYSQFDNVSIDLFRKILDGTVRIPTRKEVIDRTKVVIINDVNSNDINETFSSPQTLTEGLYRMDGDGNYENNKTFFKKTGRYPTIPTVYQLDDNDANSFQLKINRSEYSSRWPSIESKVTELNKLFPQEYKGDLYAGRNENGWVTYNPYKTGKAASSCIPFKYNTCDSMRLSYSQYTAGIIKEYPDKVTFYLNNYDNVINTNLKNDTIIIYGSIIEPTFISTDRGNSQASIISKSWSNGKLTLFVKHNGALDIAVNCSGAAAGRLTTNTPSILISPQKPALYIGSRQYEVECADYKSISSLVNSGYSGNIRNYTGQGYILFGTNSNASIRDTVRVLRKGVYKIQTRYRAPSGNVSTIDLYVNGTKVATPNFNMTSSAGEWAINTQLVSLKEGSNSILLKANSTGSYEIAFDNLVISQDNINRVYDFTTDDAITSASSPAAQFISVKSGTAGVVSYIDGNNLTSNCIKAYSVGTLNGTGVADLDLFPPSASDYYIVWKEYYGTTGGKKGILLRGTGANGSCSYGTGMKQGYLFIAQNNDDNSVTLKPYIANSVGLIEKTSYTTGFKVLANQPCWYRATAVGNTLKFECSNDSVNWVGGNTSTFKDESYTTGSTEQVWGLGSDNFSWTMDNINYLAGSVSSSKTALNGFSYMHNDELSTSKSFTVSGNSLTGNIIITAPDNFEVSLSPGSGYASLLTLHQNNSTIATILVYVRLKSGLDVNSYSGQLLLNSNGIPDNIISLNGIVTPQLMTRKYDFSSDVATTVSGTPPALNTSIGSGNGSTAGVVTYKDASNITSNMFKPYSSGIRNVTGVVNLGLFSKKSTDYSVIWKQCLGASGTDSKVGVLLRGDSTRLGDASTGYVQGLMNGYLFIAYNTTGHSEFRIYKSTSATSLAMLVNTSVSTLIPTNNQAVWYRASVSGSSSVSLKIEFSTDSITWNAGGTSSDNLTPFTSGATQLVWGLGANNVNFYVDNITFYGIEASPATTTDLILPMTSKDVKIISTEYYAITGVRVIKYNNNLKGIFIVRNHMSDGSVISKKVIFN